MRRLAAVVLVAALAAPAGAAWLPSAGAGHACALACPLGHGAACCGELQDAGRGPSFHRCAREEAALAPTALPPALPVAIVRHVRRDPSRPADVSPDGVPASPFSPAIDHIPLSILLIG